MKTKENCQILEVVIVLYGRIQEASPGPSLTGCKCTSAPYWECFSYAWQANITQFVRRYECPNVRIHARHHCLPHCQIHYGAAQPRYGQHPTHNLCVCQH